MRAHLTLLLALCAAAAAAQDSIPEGLPRDAHQGLTVAADAVTDAARSKELFGKKHPQGEGILPVEVFFRNDTHQGIRVALEEVRLILRRPDGSRQRLVPLDLESLLERMLLGKPPNAQQRRIPLPLPLPRSSRSKEWQKLEERIRPHMLAMDVIPPGATVRGFLFFDLDHRFEWLEGARLYLPEVVVLPEEKPLFYFELTLQPR